MMNKINLLGILLVIKAAICNGSEGEFAVSRIPAALLKNANAVVRVDEQRFEIISTTKLSERNRFVVTVLNEKGAGLALFEEYYDKLRKVHSIEGYLYDATGKQISKMKTRDAEDLSGVGESSLFDESRVKRFSFSHRVYPYTVEFIYEMERNHSLHFPGWVAQPDEFVSVEQSSMEVISPVGYQYRHKAFNYPGPPVTKIDGKTKIDTWKVRNVPAFEPEPYSPPFHEIVTMVLLAPTEFRVGDYSGNMTTWKDFGKFVYALNQGRDELPDHIVTKVRELTSGITDEVSKVKILYQYLQKNTRYIFVALGIGGWQPFDAKYVASKSYGDCKALTNYMYALLKVAGIRSYYTLVNSGRNQTGLHADFPAQQFDHAILCVPLEKDTMWLECTSQTMPAGYLGDFTNDRLALLIDAEGGKLVMTKQYGAEMNLQSRNVRAVLDEDATLRFRSVTTYTGLQMDDVHLFINSLSRERIKEYLQRDLDFATYDISAFNYREDKGMDPVVEETLDISVNSYATFTGKRLFIVPNVMNRRDVKLTEGENRRFDILLHSGYLDIDSVTIELPSGYVPESLPAESRFQSPFGEYESRIMVQGNIISYYRRLLYRGGRFPASTFAELVKFNDQIYKADRARVVLVRNP